MGMRTSSAPCAQHCLVDDILILCDREVLQAISEATTQAVQAMLEQRAAAATSPPGLALAQSLQQQLRVSKAAMHSCIAGFLVRSPQVKCNTSQHARSAPSVACTVSCSYVRDRVCLQSAESTVAAAIRSFPKKCRMEKPLSNRGRRNAHLQDPCHVSSSSRAKC